ncbi:MAG TPA: hypothetical protein VGO55_03095 [Allosphingosinicella sp.]|nr:hypothetical protein [Allosphingosinicella sp.]
MIARLNRIARLLADIAFWLAIGLALYCLFTGEPSKAAMQLADAAVAFFFWWKWGQG